MKEFDYIIIGGGCAGLSLAYELNLHQKLKNKTLAIIEPRDNYKKDKTWSFWKVASHNFDDCVKKSWENFSVNIPKETEWSTASASPILVRSRLVVPLSTIETIAPINPKHECCKSSGGVALLDAKTGDIIWSHRVLEEAKYVGKVFVTRTKKFAPAGAAVWNAPGVDLVNKRIFFGTGQSTQSPASEFSDAIISIDLETGNRIWFNFHGILLSCEDNLCARLKG